MDILEKIYEEMEKREQKKGYEEIYGYQCKKGMDIALEMFDFDNWVRFHIDEIVEKRDGWRVNYIIVDDGEEIEINQYQKVRVY